MYYRIIWYGFPTVTEKAVIPFASSLNGTDLFSQRIWGFLPIGSITLQMLSVLGAMLSDCSSPFFHIISTVNPPRAQSPLTVPFFHVRGKAGRGRKNPSWLCNSISQTPAVPPNLPSIWKGGCLSQRLGWFPCATAFCKAYKSVRRRRCVPRRLSDVPLPSL